MNDPTRRPLIAVDIGNTSTHFGRFAAAESVDVLPKPVDRFRLPTAAGTLDDLATWLTEGPVSWCVASVHRGAAERLRTWVENERGEPIQLLDYRDVPIEIDVDRPDRVGMDRLVAAVAANVVRQEGRPAVVIDLGTAVTVDVVDDRGRFAGGAILPGLRLAASALADRTDALPEVLVDLARPPDAVGKSTEKAIQSGLYWGTVGGVRELIARVADDYSSRPHVLLTGGDTRRLAPLLDERTRWIPHLVLAGIALSIH